MSAPSCDASQSKLSGSIDGSTVEQTYSSTGYALVLKDFSGGIGAQGNLKVTLAQAGASSAGTPIASGVLKLPAEGPHAGESFCVGGGTLASGTGYTFTLTSLSKLAAGSDATACPGAPVSGTIAGCVRGSK